MFLYITSSQWGSLPSRTAQGRVNFAGGNNAACMNCMASLMSPAW